MLNNCSKTVTMGNYNNILTLHYAGSNCIVPIWKHTVTCCLKRFSAGQSVRWNVLVHLLEWRMAFIAHIKLWWRDVVTASPNLDLSFTVLFSSLRLVQTLKRTVGSLVESPAFLKWNPEKPHLACDVIVGFYGALKCWSVSKIKVESFFL